MFAADVTDAMRVGAGGGLEDTGEAIEALALPLENADAFLADPSLARSAGLMFGLLWLRQREAAKAGKA